MIFNINYPKEPEKSCFFRSKNLTTKTKVFPWFLLWPKILRKYNPSLYKDSRRVMYLKLIILKSRHLCRVTTIRKWCWSRFYSTRWFTVTLTLDLSPFSIDEKLRGRTFMTTSLSWPRSSDLYPLYSRVKLLLFFLFVFPSLLGLWRVVVTQMTTRTCSKNRLTIFLPNIDESFLSWSGPPVTPKLSLFCLEWRKRLFRPSDRLVPLWHLYYINLNSFLRLFPRVLLNFLFYTFIPVLRSRQIIWLFVYLVSDSCRVVTVRDLPGISVPK